MPTNQTIAEQLDAAYRHATAANDLPCAEAALRMRLTFARSNEPMEVFNFWSQLALVIGLQGRTGEALPMLTAVLLVDPHAPAIYFATLAALHFEDGHWRLAFGLLDQAERAHGKRSEISLLRSCWKELAECPSTNS